MPRKPKRRRWQRARARAPRRDATRRRRRSRLYRRGINRGQPRGSLRTTHLPLEQSERPTLDMISVSPFFHLSFFPFVSLSIGIIVSICVSSCLFTITMSKYFKCYATYEWSWLNRDPAAVALRVERGCDWPRLMTRCYGIGKVASSVTVIVIETVTVIETGNERDCGNVKSSCVILKSSCDWCSDHGCDFDCDSGCDCDYGSKSRMKTRFCWFCCGSCYC